MNDDRTTAEKKRKLYFILTVAEIVIGIAGIAVFVVSLPHGGGHKGFTLSRFLLALVMIVSGTGSLLKILKARKAEKDEENGSGDGE